LSVYFIDTSSLAKRYVAEKGSVWIRSLLSPQNGHTIIVPELCLVETVSLLAKKGRSTDKDKITATQVQIRSRLFLVHARKEYFPVPVTRQELTLARKLILKHSNCALRALDAIQLAAASYARNISLQPITFIASDSKLQCAAINEGFAVDDPENYS
jgi:predicted nucleic acid-binding protein